MTLSIDELEEKLKTILDDFTFAGTTCEFYGEEHLNETCEEHGCGLWLSAEEGNYWKGTEISVFDYWGYDMDYEEKESIMHVYKPFHMWLETQGWWTEYHDPGTVMLYRR